MQQDLQIGQGEHTLRSLAKPAIFTRNEHAMRSLRRAYTTRSWNNGHVDDATRHRNLLKRRLVRAGDAHANLCLSIAQLFRCPHTEDNEERTHCICVASDAVRG